MKIDCSGKNYDILNQEIAGLEGDIALINCCGQRFIGAGASGKRLTISGVPGNALGAYLDGAEISVLGNAQDATGDTMNAGRIVINGSCGDAVGYAMRGGEIYVRGNVGYRAGIHMKSYEDKVPVLVIGGRCGSFLGEYQAGGLIIALGLGYGDREVLDNFCATGMHGGKIFIRANTLHARISPQISVRDAGARDLALIAPHIREFCTLFGKTEPEIYEKSFKVLSPNSSNPYHQLYVQN
ncbi:MAG: glutamate synthase [Oscillospiraceae bacterium]|jgi:glutamate synthase domain-containing protein 3|nr:glutamate synthase [Oscillospiraceae bacterium]